MIVLGDKETTLSADGGHTIRSEGDSVIKMFLSLRTKLQGFQMT